MIDLHAHIVPGVDDGPADMPQALDLTRQAVERGVTSVLATPHVRPATHGEEWSYIEEQYRELSRALTAEGIGLRTRLGAEIFYEPGVERLVEDPRLSIDGAGRYFLIEVSMGGEPEGAESGFSAFAGAGHRPVLAHPERIITFLEEPERLDDYLEGGSLIQVNAGSLLGRHRPGARPLAEFLVTSGRAQIVASDAHDTIKRPFALAEARARIVEIAGEERARELVEENPRRLLAGERIEVVPSPVTAADWPRRIRSSWLGSLARRVTRKGA